MLYQAAGTWLDRRRYPAPGHVCLVNGRRMHIHAAGSGGPVVVLESGIAASSLNWRKVWQGVARFTTVCAYDRAGFGWSEPGTGRRTPSRIVEELRALLAAAGLAGPYILAGHSFGGLAARWWAARYPDEAAGMLLIDPLHPREWSPLSGEQRRMLAAGVRLSRRGAALARFGVVRFCLALAVAGGRFIPRLAARVSAGRGAFITDRMVGEVRKMPPEVWPMVRAHWSRPESFRTMAAHLEALPASAAEVSAIPMPRAIPWIVVLAGDANTVRRDGYQEDARLSGRGKLVDSPAGHWIHLDEPELAVEAIRELVERARNSGDAGQA